jgi:N-acyl-D-aspartate/D-glutamate deacylase
MKVQGIEQGTAASVLATMRKTTQGGAYTAADAYPYLAGQSGLGALIIPGWAQEGGRPAMLKRFADPAARAKIITEAEQAMTARFGGPQGVYLPRTQQELTDVMKQMNAGAGETIVRILETTGDPGAILRFGSEADLVKILQEPVTSMACDCGATTQTRVHPRFYGSFPRLLGRYVREQKIMSWEEAIRKSSGLPAATIGMVDRGFIAPGMAADIAVFDPATIIDHSTYDNPSAPPEGIKHLLVNGQFAVRDGVATGARAGKALKRTTNMPSRPMSSGARRISARGQLGEYTLTLDATQSPNARAASGTLVLTSKTPAATLRATQLGVIQSMKGWSSITAVAQDRAIIVIVEDGKASAVSVSPRSQ